MAICSTNLARDKMRSKKEKSENLDLLGPVMSYSENPEQRTMEKEELRRLRTAVSKLPYEQREVVVLHLKSGLKFKEIAELQGVSVNTIQGRYRYGLKKLRSILNHEVQK